jgi:hypothetical protein
MAKNRKDQGPQGNPGQPLKKVGWGFLES